MSLEVLEATVRIAKTRREKIMKSFILMVLMLSWGVLGLFLDSCFLMGGWWGI